MAENSEQKEVVRLLMEQRTGLLAYILAIVRDYDLAEDVLQEVSMTVCEISDQFREGTNFGAWVREIARRRILAHNRAAARFPGNLTREELNQLDAGFESVESEASMRERLNALRRCLQTLTNLSRRLLQLRFAGRYPYREIAEQIGRQPESVRKTVYRSRQVLRTCIERRLGLVDGEI
ncbi:MAG: sigma-70 family RNA polymerase sigma factor [Planctomycetaceae bacterium]|nr:sigma-70 family RNA polymerase sigma factor [Planctomycetaceae bacterium]